MKPERGKRKEKVPQTIQKPEESTSWGFLKGVLLNLTGGIISVVFLYIIFSNIQGYDWMYNTMLKGNLETIDKYPNLTLPERYEAKWGGEIGYVYSIRQQTPDSAVIIIPPRALLTKAGFKSVQELPWLTYFLYPRKVVYEDDKATSKTYSSATYILAVNGWGFDRVNYHIDKPEAFMILPLKK